MKLILYSKPGCHLCEGLQEKLERLAGVGDLDFELEMRDITTRAEWFEVYQYEIPVLCCDREGIEHPLPRPSPRASDSHISRLLRQYSS
ncbi:glutaredoxin [Rubidibacter lacunae KORDI 51-2]|uniref:Glutaredoxin n=1 Tax=Rubidibacter lacunae KORDI 51-2 TaxID=582515 RepID=U5DIH4_9CHRO|nr:glutaredoxin family protein [Rubidibacter lacunae]ERN40737.1 glutaredoxin [Rubidibacter lacunae KORDI 51-2]